MDDQIIYQEWKSMNFGGQVPITIPLKSLGNIWLPCGEGEEPEAELSAIFRTMTFEDFAVMEDLISVDYKINEQETVRELDFSGMRWLMMRRLPLSWNLPIPLEYENGWMKEESFSRLKRLPAPLVNAMLNEYQPHASLSRDEEVTIDRQSLTLFNENSRGVINACKAISLYCLLTSFWEKFGISRFDIPNMQYKEYLMLRQMIGNDNEATRRRIKKSQTSSSKVNTRGRRKPMLIPERGSR